jgi:hypothetical protein
MRLSFKLFTAMSKVVEAAHEPQISETEVW